MDSQWLFTITAPLVAHTHSSDGDDGGLVLPLVLVDLLGNELSFGATHQRRLAAMPDVQLRASVQHKHTAQVQGTCHTLHLHMHVCTHTHTIVTMYVPMYVYCTNT